jgi:hypothetical protein
VKIELKEITVRELTNGYKNNDEEGVVGYGDKLDIRHPTNGNLFTKTNSVML